MQVRTTKKASSNSRILSPNYILPLQTGIIHALNLNAYLFLQAVEHLIAAYAARAICRRSILVRIKAHGARLLGQVFGEVILTIPKYACRKKA